MSDFEAWLSGVLFILVFPVLWFIAAYLDRIWPTTTERLERHKAGMADESPE